MRRGSTFWGLVFIVAGTLFLLNTIGFLTVNVWGVIWPVFLVLLGLWIMAGAFMSPRSRDVEQTSVPLSGASRARVSFHHAAGRLTVNSGAAADVLLEGSFGGGVNCRSQKDGDRIDATLRMREQAFWGPWSWSPVGFNWDVKLNDNIPIALEFDTGAGENRIDLTNLQVDEVRLKTGASATEIALPSRSARTNVRVDAGAASVSLRVPQSVAARIRARGGLAGVDIDTTRFPRSGDFYQSREYDTAANRVDIEVELGVGSIKVR